MKYSVTRIEISPELNELLEQHIQTLIENTGKSQTKKKVLAELCQAGLEYQKFMESQGPVNQSMQGMDQSTSEDQAIETIREINAIQDALMKKEKRLQIKEKYLDNRAERINAMHLSTLQLREEATEMKINSLNFNGSRLNDDLQRKELQRTLDELKRENNSDHRQMHRILKDIQSNTKKEFFKDTLLPLITPAMLGYIFLQKNNEEESQKMDPTIKESLHKIAAMDPSNKAEINSEIMKLMDKFSDSSTNRK